MGSRQRWLFALWGLGLVAAQAADAQTIIGTQRPDGDAVDERLRRATVMVRTHMTKIKKSGHGSGVLVNRTGLVITNNHVVDPNHNKPPEQRIAIAQAFGKITHEVYTDLATPRERKYNAKVIHQSEPCDVALVQLLDEKGNPPSTPNYITFMPNESLRTGIKILTMGFPGEGENWRKAATRSDGLVTQLLRSQSGAVSFVETDATVVPGNSGGPVVDSGGQLIGIVSLLKAGEGTKNTCGVVPGHLVKQFVKTAFEQGRMPEKIDVLPFMELFMNENDVLKLPGIDRVSDAAVIHRRDGTIRQCALGFDQLSVNTPVGRMDVPAAALAYILVDNGTGTLLMDGGDRLTFPATGLSLAVKVDGKSEQVKLNDVVAIACPLRPRPLAPLTGTGVIVQPDGCSLGLADVKGEISVEGARFPLANVTLIESDPTGNRTVSSVKGERVRGKLAATPITARVCWSAKPVQLKLDTVEQAFVRPADWSLVHARGRRLSERLALKDPELKAIADLLDGPDWQKAHPLIEAKAKIAGQPLTTSKTLRLFRALEVVRGGDAEAAKAELRKLPKDQLVAQAYLRVYERYPDGTYLGEKLSVPDVMWRASTGEALRALAAVTPHLDDAEKRRDDPPKLDEDTRTVMALQKYEKELDVIDQLEVGVAQSSLIRVLESQYYFQIKRFHELRNEHADAVAEIRSATSRGSFQRSLARVRALEAQLEAIRKDITRIISRLRTDSVGFKLEPPTFKREEGQ
ncbi:MAG: trypsin-like peptidase domain-containing protein [Phycisphaerae bacterium]|jgi:S1-C subfamily serine protease